MKVLFLMRHAKSSWDDSSLADFERPLNARGKRTAPMMGKLMKQNGLLPEMIVSSPAERARETALLVSQSAGLTTKIEFNDRIYEAGPLQLLEVAGSFSGGVSSAMIVGHNPGTEGFIWHLSGVHEPMPTCALAIVHLEIGSWTDIRDNCGVVADVLRPKALGL